MQGAHVKKLYEGFIYNTGGHLFGFEELSKAKIKNTKKAISSLEDIQSSFNKNYIIFTKEQLAKI